MMDAGIERERLALDLADWKAAGFISSEKARRWHRAVSRLAKATRLPRAQVMADLTQDAVAMIEEGYERPTKIDELGHLSASEMMRVTRAQRDARELAALKALYEGGEVRS